MKPAAPESAEAASSEAIERLEGILGHRFARRAHLETALRHASHAHELGGKDEVRKGIILPRIVHILIPKRAPYSDEVPHTDLQTRFLKAFTNGALLWRLVHILTSSRKRPKSIIRAAYE